jgi:hypothetical protein
MGTKNISEHTLNISEHALEYICLSLSECPRNPRQPLARKKEGGEHLSTCIILLHNGCTVL